MSRAEHLCNAHRTGVLPGTPAFFVDYCLACQRKRDAGKVTGNEPPPPDIRKKRQDGYKRLALARKQALLAGYVDRTEFTR